MSSVISASRTKNGRGLNGAKAAAFALASNGLNAKSATSKGLPSVNAQSKSSRGDSLFDPTTNLIDFDNLDAELNLVKDVDVDFLLASKTGGSQMKKRPPSGKLQSLNRPSSKGKPLTSE